MGHPSQIVAPPEQHAPAIRHFDPNSRSGREERERLGDWNCPPPQEITEKNKKKTINENTTKKNVPFTGQINLGSVVASLVRFVARSKVGVGSRSTIFASDAEIDFFLSVDARVGERGRGSSIFPFDARSVIELDFSLYSCLSSFRDSVTPVRRREDTEGDGDAGVKVQIDRLWSVLSRMPFELLKTTRKVDKKRLDWGKSFSKRRELVREVRSEECDLSFSDRWGSKNAGGWRNGRVEELELEVSRNGRRGKERGAETSVEEWRLAYLSRGESWQKVWVCLFTGPPGPNRAADRPPEVHVGTGGATIILSACIHTIILESGGRRVFWKHFFWLVLQGH